MISPTASDQLRPEVKFEHHIPALMCCCMNLCPYGNCVAVFVCATSPSILNVVTDSFVCAVIPSVSAMLGRLILTCSYSFGTSNCSHGWLLTRGCTLVATTSSLACCSGALYGVRLLAVQSSASSVYCL